MQFWSLVNLALRFPFTSIYFRLLLYYIYISTSSSPNFLNMEGSEVKMKEPTFVIFCFTNFHHQTFSLYILRLFSFSFALWMCNFMFCYLTLILTTVSREATNQQFPKSLKHIGQIRLTLLYIYDIFASHGIILHLPHTANLHVTPSACEAMPRITTVDFTCPYCYAHTLRCGLTSEPAWNEVVTAFCFTRTSLLESHCADGHPLVVFFASRKLVAFSLFLSPLPIY